MPDESSTNGTYNAVLPDEKTLAAEVERTQTLLQERKRIAIALPEKVRVKKGMRTK